MERVRRLHRVDVGGSGRQRSAFLIAAIAATLAEEPLWDGHVGGVERKGKQLPQRGAASKKISSSRGAEPQACGGSRPSAVEDEGSCRKRRQRLARPGGVFSSTREGVPEVYHRSSGPAWFGWFVRPGEPLGVISVRAGLAVLLLLFVSQVASPTNAAFGRAAPPSGPVTQDPEGRRAYDDLGRYYADKDSIPPYDKAIDVLASQGPAEGREAGRYLLRLFEQSLADETNGRAQWVQTPYWGGGASSHAREFRERLAESFGKGADRKSTRLNSSHSRASRMPSSA